jgi:N-acetylmuramoyl-L-alanine amidase
MHVEPLPYEDRLEPRPLSQVDLVVVHCTELPDLRTAREYGQRIVHPDSGTGNSGHWYIDRDGSAVRYVRADRIAHHVRGYNPRALGIELVNIGRWPQWLDSRYQAMDEAYPEAQIDALLQLLGTLQATLPSLRWIAGHEDLDTDTEPASDKPDIRVRRKRDPGPLFPWPRVLASTSLQRMWA